LEKPASFGAKIPATFRQMARKMGSGQMASGPLLPARKDRQTTDDLTLDVVRFAEENGGIVGTHVITIQTVLWMPRLIFFADAPL
jgi:hypothetical protein